MSLLHSILVHLHLIHEDGDKPHDGSETGDDDNQPVDIEAVLRVLNQDRLAADPNAPPLNWDNSVVDLLKLLGLDSSREARTELAAELGHRGEVNDWVEMNEWLHREVMKHVANNGGKVPDTWVIHK